MKANSSSCMRKQTHASESKQMQSIASNCKLMLASVSEGKQIQAKASESKQIVAKASKCKRTQANTSESKQMQTKASKCKQWTILYWVIHFLIKWASTHASKQASSRSEPQRETAKKGDGRSSPARCHFLHVVISKSEQKKICGQYCVFPREALKLSRENPLEKTRNKTPAANIMFSLGKVLKWAEKKNWKIPENKTGKTGAILMYFFQDFTGSVFLD